MTASERERAKDKFLEVYAMTANIMASCHDAGIDRSTVYRWKESDDTFLIRFNLASEDANDRIRGEIFRRAMFGEERIITSMGKVVYYEDKPLTIKEKSDALLMFAARARMPEYRDKPLVDLGSQTADRELQKLQDAIAEALRPYPEIQERVSNALAEKGL